MRIFSRIVGRVRAIFMCRSHQKCSPIHVPLKNRVIPADAAIQGFKSPSHSYTHCMPKLLLQSLLGFIATSLFILPSFAATSPVGATQGQFKVSESGAANYTIPIAVPPSTAGMQPSLSLSYNSQGGNGLLGMGWSLGGLSSISRCPQTQAQDGVRGAVNFDANDRFCLDGQRLIVISGVYGAAGAEYRTERESYSRIISYGAAGNGPAYFKVWTKSGQVMEYGVTADSQIEAQGKTSVMVWALNKVQDTVGNYLNVTYLEDNANGQFYPTRIDYTGNAGKGLAPFNSVQFVYEARPDVTPAYHAGSLMKTTVRMTKVQGYAGTTLTREYRLAYTQGTATQRSRLATVTECAGDGVCLAPTSFAWSSENVGLVSDPNRAVLGGSDSAFSHSGTDGGLRVVDLNSDGRPDLLHEGYFLAGQFSGGLIARAFIHGATNYVQQDAFAGLAGTDSGFSHNGTDGGLRDIDLNGDGYPDLLHAGYFSSGEYGGGNVQRSFINTKSGYVSANSWASAIGDSGFVHSGRDGGLRVVDLNGDGLPDLLHIGYFTSGEYGGGYIRRAFINTGTTFVRNDAWAILPGSDSAFSHNGNDGGMRVVDLNGDGLPDLLHIGYFTQGQFGGSQVNRAFINTGSGFVRDDSYAILGTDSAFCHDGKDDGMRTIDLNGDGLLDLLHVGYFTQGQFGGGYIRRAYISTGRGFIRNDSLAILGSTDSAFTHDGRDDGMRDIDINGDGLPDLVHAGYFTQGEFGGGNVQRAFINTGNGFILDNSWVAAIRDSGFVHAGRDGGMRVIDFNGDTMQDLLHVGYFTSGEYGGGYIPFCIWTILNRLVTSRFH